MIKLFRFIAITVCCHAVCFAAAPPKSPPGLIATFKAKNSQPDSRIARLAALYVPANTPASTFTPAGPFTATLSGNLELKLRDDLSFSLAGRGTIKLSINGQEILSLSGDNWRHEPTKTITLNKGKNAVLIEYTSPATGDAFFRLYWSSSEFPAEPIPPTIFTHEPTPALESASQLREGRFLFTNLRCLNCHSDDSLKPASESARRATTTDFTADLLKNLPMPELAIDAPSFENIGSRINQAWIAHWITNPKSLRHNATMPKPPIDENKAGNIAAYLASLTATEKSQDPPTSDELIAAGGRLFAHRHCIACHTLPDSEKVDVENGRTPLMYLKAKFKPAALFAFLKNPQQHYAWIRMPNFKLSDLEAQRLTAFLLSRPQKSLSDVKGDSASGKQLVQNAGCLNCHALPDKTPSGLKSPPLANLDQGCLAPVSQKAPQFNLTDSQRQSIVSFLKTDRSSLARESLPEFAQRQILHLRCTACHTRDNVDDLYPNFDEEVAPLIADGTDDEPAGEGDERISEDQSEPILTWAGEKLKAEWTTKLLLGQHDYKLRPWLRARMPAFPARANLLAHALPLEHGFPPVSSADPPSDPSLAPLGRKLLGKDGGFACTTCHGVASLKPVGVFEAPGPNLQYASERLTHHYFERWVYNPLRVHKDTKMPAFADKDGKTSLRETLDGDARRQYEAIYNYLLPGRKVDPPDN